MTNSIHFELMNWCSCEILEIYEAEIVYVCICVYTLFVIFYIESWQKQIISIQHGDLTFLGWWQPAYWILHNSQYSITEFLL